MAEGRPGGRISRIPQEHRGSHPTFVSRETRITEPTGMDKLKSALDKATDPHPPISPERQRLADFFKGRELPKVVWVPAGTVYYPSTAQIIPLDSKNRGRNEFANVDGVKIEKNGFTVRSILPPMEGESSDASFKFVGQRGLYVRVITGYEQNTEGENATQKPIFEWVPWNEDDASAKDIRYT